ncbi:MAG: hypothetical protein HW416_2725 [Chloroflexi bacterium]|nr:hypothetical protein [Chloroflexota bacterium]
MSLVETYAATVKKYFDRSPFGQWQASEDVQTMEGLYVEDVWKLELATWPRLGGNALFVNLLPMMERATSLYVAEAPPGGALEPERHLYEKFVVVLSGHGATEVWQEGDTSRHVFEWGPGSVFSPPINTWHRMFNHGQEPARFMCVIDAPQIMNGFRNAEFVFNCNYAFRDRFNGREDYFSVSNKRQERGRTTVWETNLIHDCLEADLDTDYKKASGGQITAFEMSGNSLVGHISEWPVGRYHKAHYHGPGAMLMGLRSEGFVLIWSSALGNRPYENGRGSDVVEVPWKRGTIYAPPGKWFHQHFNTGREPARNMAIRYGSTINLTDFGPLVPDHFMEMAGHEERAMMVSTQEGGTLLEYEDEDPAVRERFEAALTRNGVESQMPPSLYEADAAKEAARALGG